MLKKIARVISVIDQQEIYTESYANSKNVQHSFVISHGMGGDSNATIPFIQEVLKRIPNTRCITYDIRGHGYSPRNFANFETIEEILTLDLQSICQHYQVSKPIFIGHSLGGLICQEYVNQRLLPAPQSLILLSSFPYFPLPNLGRKFWMKMLSGKKNNQRKPTKRSVDDHFRFYQSFDYSLGRIISDIQHTSIRDFLLMYLSLCGWKNKHPQLLDKQGNLYIYGKNDLVILPTIQKRFCQNFTQIKLFQISSNHNSIFNSPGKIVEIIVPKQKD